MLPLRLLLAGLLLLRHLLLHLLLLSRAGFLLLLALLLHLLLLSLLRLTVPLAVAVILALSLLFLPAFSPLFLLRGRLPALPTARRAVVGISHGGARQCKR